MSNCLGDWCEVCGGSQQHPLNDQFPCPGPDTASEEE